MPNNLNITQITPPRVAIIDERTGAVSREWYRFFYNLYYATGGTTGGFIPPGRGGTGTGVTPTDGQLLIGNGVTGVYNVTDLGTGDGIAKTVGPGLLSIENTGVLSNIAGDGISVSSATGDVTIENTGVLSVTAGQGITVDQPTGDVTVAVGTQPYLDFDDDLTNPAYQQGRLFYDNTNKALAYYNDAPDVTVQIGQENIVRVYNNTGSTILNGKVCYINGAFGAFPTVALAKADSSTTSQATLGICTADILTGEYGYITTDGVVHDINTNGMTAGAPVYLSDATAGAFTMTAPLQPSYDIIVGYVTEVSATTGAVYVHIDRLPWFPNGEIRLTAASTTLPTTPTVFTAPSVITQQGMSYDNATGVLTINTSGSFTLSHTFNCEPSASNKNVYFYVEESTDGGSTWVIARYSARELKLPNATQTQLIIVGSRYYATGTKIRYYLWGDATVYLKTADLAGTTPGTVTLPAYRLTLAG